MGRILGETARRLLCSFGVRQQTNTERVAW
jgi:hypothetical protein